MRWQTEAYPVYCGLGDDHTITVTTEILKGGFPLRRVVRGIHSTCGVVGEVARRLGQQTCEVEVNELRICLAHGINTAPASLQHPHVREACIFAAGTRTRRHKETNHRPRSDVLEQYLRRKLDPNAAVGVSALSKAAGGNPRTEFSKEGLVIDVIVLGQRWTFNGVSWYTTDWNGSSYTPTKVEVGLKAISRKALRALLRVSKPTFSDRHNMIQWLWKRAAPATGEDGERPSVSSAGAAPAYPHATAGA